MSRFTVVLLVAALVVSACAGEQETVAADVDLGGEPEVEQVDEEDGSDEASPVPEPTPDDDRPASPLTGLPVDEEVLDSPLLQVKIENSPQARPQTGLETADIVYEELVEGGVTRFFAIFHSEIPDIAGPVRSARPVDTQLMSGYGRNGFAYSGARDEVRRMLADTPSIRITEGGAGFHRDPDRSAPHDLYIEAPVTHAEVAERDPEPVTDVGWVFDEQPPDGARRCAPGDEDPHAPQDPPATDEGVEAGGDAEPASLQDAEAAGGCELGTSMSVAMSQFFTTGWEYDDAAGVYRRLQDGEPFTVTGPDPIGAANVVVLETRHYIGESGYPESDVVTDVSPAVIMRDGRRYEARWSKASPGEPIELHGADGEPFPLKPGPTWVLLPDADGMPATGR